MSSSRGGIHAYSAGCNFTTHVITANDGEDITVKIMRFSQKRSHAICILAANGTISKVTLRHSTSSGGNVTYEGSFELVSLSGSFVPIENEFSKRRSGGLNVSFVGPDGQTIGGGLAGLLVAGGHVQVVIGSFLPGKYQRKHKPKKQRLDHVSTTAPAHANHISTRVLGGVEPIMTPYGFQVNNNIAAFSNGEGSMNSSAGVEAHFPGSYPTQSDVGHAH